MSSDDFDARASRILVLDVGLATPGPSRALLPSRQLRGLIDSIVEASTSHSAAMNDSAASSSVAPPAEEAQEDTVPWLINNRYYSAAVHFAPRSIPLFAKNEPAASRGPGRRRAAEREEPRHLRCTRGAEPSHRYGDREQEDSLV
ncbi:hypothetical protein FA09DRAFT_258901 [Tilletiopsis washingtonensis]|uniref:Uncharacterized protein n=1 Tax=Tilletiopsis washingtonensis TaxID=58919 RepID=A0A316ZCZ4_9BASI|nr:hypothetical protein FA09DRAFT_258901 [Tilletiopsis washingtonensis]PWN98918.1 hypothetical protein FA09DRAFT_258901 [Tilletiopsis washingtonensis]